MLVVAALGGCAAPAERAPYEGVLTGEVVDGRWVVRFPPIDVVARRGTASAE